MGATELTAIIVAIVTGFFGVVAEIARRSGIRREAMMERELKFQAAALDFSDYMREWNEINAEILALFKETSIDRFLILRAWNGELQPRWTTAFFQMRSEGQQAFSYTHVQLDDDYVNRLRDTIGSGSIVFSVTDAPPSLIKSIYDFEGVKHSAWFSIDKTFLNHPNGKREAAALTYCSFASRNDEPLTDAEIIRCRMIASRIKGVAHTMNGHEDR